MGCIESSNGTNPATDTIDTHDTYTEIQQNTPKNDENVSEIQKEVIADSKHDSNINIDTIAKNTGATATATPHKTEPTHPKSESSDEIDMFGDSDTNEITEVTLVKVDSNNNNALKLVKLFESNQDEFYEFVSDNIDMFVGTVIDIILDKTAISDTEKELEMMLFRELRNSPDLWTDLPFFIKGKLKQKLLHGLDAVQGSEDKTSILAHIICIVATFEEWKELAPALIDLKSAKDSKLRTLLMLAHWKPERLSEHALPIIRIIYTQILEIDQTNLSSHQTLSLFRTMDTLLTKAGDTIKDTELVMNIMESTVTFLLQTYVENYEIDMKFNKSTFDGLQYSIDKPFTTAKLCLNILHSMQFHYFAALSVQMRDALFFLSNAFLKMSALKVKSGVINTFPEKNEEWEEKHWDFACVANTVFSVFIGWTREEKTVLFNYFDRYFREMYDEYSTIENLVSNIDYDSTHESVWGFWTNVLKALSKDYIRYFWHRTDLLIPLLSQKHPTEACSDLCELRKKAYNQEWLAVRWFVRNNYEPLYDQLRIPIMEMILKYLSEYAATNIVERGSDEIYHHRSLRIEFDVPGLDTQDYDPNSIDYNVSNEMFSKFKRECLISGFLKSETLIFDSVMPETIGAIINDFYPWIIERFDTFVESEFELENEQTLIKLTKCGADRTIYGRINIEPSNEDIHEWTFKVLSKGQITFGIDESDCKLIESGFQCPSETRAHYCYSFTGGKYNMNLNYKPYGEKYGINDVITMIFDGRQRTLRFCKNGSDQKINADGIDLSKTFKMAVCLFFYDENDTHCSVELLSYKCSTLQR